MEGKVVLVTGASSGIGAGIALHLASLGCRLSLVARGQEALQGVARECREAGAGEVLVLAKDLALEEACRAAVAETVDHFGRLDVLVNSAGILMAGSIESLSVSDYDSVMNINTRSALILTQAAVPALLLSKGNIVHISR